MIPQKRKLTKDDFSYQKIPAKKAYSDNATLIIFKTKPNDNTKFSFIVSKAVSKKSVIRNKLKRIGYRTINSVLKNIENGFNCLFFFKKSASNATEDVLHNEIVYLLRKTGVLL